MDKLKPVLLIDDSAEDVELTILALQSEARLLNPIDVARDGEEALDYLFRRGPFSDRTSQNPEVIILDLKMPKIGGIEVLEALNKDDSLRSIPVVVLTSSNEERDVKASYANGANAYVVKPVDITRFMDSVKQIGLFWGVCNVVPY